MCDLLMSIINAFLNISHLTTTANVSMLTHINLLLNAKEFKYSYFKMSLVVHTSLSSTVESPVSDQEHAKQFLLHIFVNTNLEIWLLT